MERVAFLVEETGERIACLLNPESVVVRRQAGVRPLGVGVGRLTGVEAADEALLYTGGGRTELELDLLFDVSLAGSSLPVQDVRDLTHPLWQLAENVVGEGYRRPPRVRFVWGKAWNVPAVVAAVAERLERFSPGGVPERSWLRLRLLRVVDRPGAATRETSSLPVLPAAAPPTSTTLFLPEGAERNLRFHQLRGGGDGAGERLDQLAERYFGNPAMWRWIAAANAIADPLRPPANAVLAVPAPGGGGTGA